MSSTLMEEVLRAAAGVAVSDPAWYKASRTRQVHYHDTMRVDVEGAVNGPSRRTLSPFRHEIACSHVEMTGGEVTPPEVDAAVAAAQKRGFIRQDESGCWRLTQAGAEALRSGRYD